MLEKNILASAQKCIGEGITVKKDGGHFKGSCIVLCRYLNQDYVFCGDECYEKQCFEQKIATGLIIVVPCPRCSKE